MRFYLALWAAKICAVLIRLIAKDRGTNLPGVVYHSLILIIIVDFIALFIYPYRYDMIMLTLNIIMPEYNIRLILIA